MRRFFFAGSCMMASWFAVTTSPSICRLEKWVALDEHVGQTQGIGLCSGQTFRGISLGKSYRDCSQQSPRGIPSPVALGFLNCPTSGRVGSWGYSTGSAGLSSSSPPRVGHDVLERQETTRIPRNQACGVFFPGYIIGLVLTGCSALRGPAG